MRRTLIFPALAPLFCAGSLAAATVSFDPPEVYIDPANDSTVVEFDVTVQTDGNQAVVGLDILLGSDDLVLTDFVFGPPAWPSCSVDGCGLARIGIYPSDLGVGVFFSTTTSSPLLLGTLTVDASGLPSGSYDVVVNPIRDGGISNINGVEPASGHATVHVTPEPATFAWLAFGALLTSIVRRRTIG